jgi:glycine/D-amino acid oxidase-like deaminating enzyme
MTMSVWQDKTPNKLQEEVDVVIIGGGIVGCGAAYWLSKRPGLKVMLLESGRLAGGASGRNAGFVLRGLHTYYNEAVKRYGRKDSRWIFEFTEENQRLLGEFIAQYGNSFDYSKCGSYLLACSKDEFSDLEESAELMLEDGFAVELLRQDPLARNYEGALLNAGDGGIHPAKYVAAVLAASGLPAFEDEPVLQVVKDGARGILVQTGKRLVRCQKVLIATNAYAQLLDPWFADKVMPVRGQILVTKPLGKKVLDKVCYANYGWEYFRQLPDGRFLLGGCREHHIDEEVGYADTVTQSLQADLQDYLQKHFTDVADAEIDYRWSGIMGFTKDELPLVGELPSIAGAYFAAGCSGHGMGYGINMSRLLVEVALDGRDPGPFDVRRLSQVSV